MLSGRDTLGELDTTLRTARRELARLDGELQATSRAVEINKQQQAQALKRMAATRLDAIRQGDVVKRIDSADFQVREILSQRNNAIAALNERTSLTAEALRKLEERRYELHDDVDEAAQALAEREAKVQSMLESDSAFLAQLELTQKADAIAMGAAEKAEVVATDRRSKGQPYENDPLFIYLWNRHYGTAEYRANLFARLLDGWVARLCNYQRARPNYWMLQEIPRRLREHAERRRTDADKELDRLQALEEAAAEEGGVHVAKSMLVDAERRQDEIDEQIVQSEAKLHELQSEQSLFAAGEDRYITQGVNMFSDALQRRDVADLTNLARSTMTTEDDALVDDLRHLRREDDEIRGEFSRNREVHKEHLRRVQELQQVRQRFKQSRYDDLRSGFDKGDLIVSMMREVLGGAIRGGALWNVLQQYQGYREVAGAWPDFGSGGIARKRRQASTRRPTWHWPGPTGARRNEGFKLPRAPRSRPASKRGRGGFRTGGGI